MSFNLISITLVAIALAMDAFSVSMTKGFTQKDLKNSQIIYYGLFFGGFQALMPILGYFCGNVIASIVEALASIIGFILLLIIGCNMIRESLSSDGEEVLDHFSSKEAYFDIFSHNRNSCLCIQHCRNIHRKKNRGLCRQ